MYSNNFVIALCVVGIVKSSDDFRVLDAIHQEYPCTSQGGLCTIAADCPTGHLVEEKGLCPAQRSKGVECCYGMSVKETRCGKRGGQCLTKENQCSQTLRYDATDCPEETVCCIMVH